VRQTISDQKANRLEGCNRSVESVSNKRAPSARAGVRVGLPVPARGPLVQAAAIIILHHGTQLLQGQMQ
jgi:hypothetical protein